MKSIALFAVAASLLFVPVSATGDEARTWTSGKYKIDAKFVESKGDSVILEKPDGKRVTIPLNRLSEEDQAHVEALLADPTEENPFMVVEEPVPTGAPKALTIDWKDALTVARSAGSQWNVTVGESPQLDYAPRLVGLPPKTDFFEKSSGMSVSVPAKRAAISYSTGRPGAAATSRIMLVDLATGRTLHNIKLDGSYSVRHIHPDGNRIVCQRAVSKDRYGRKKDYTYETVTLADGKLNVIDTWNPFDGTEAGPHHARSMQFAADNKLVVMDEGGTVGVFDFATRQPIMQTRLPRTCLATVSPDGKLLAWCGGNSVGLIDLEKQEAVASKPAAGMNFWVQSRFSPSGKRFAAASQQKLMIWDTESGDVLFEGAVPGISLSRGLDFPDDDFVLLAGQYLVEWSSKIKAWQYKGAGSRICSHGHLFCVAGEGLVTAKLPHPQALKMLDEARNQSDLFVVRKGVPLAIDVSNVKEEYRQQVSKALEAQVVKIGCTVAADAKVTVTANITGPVKSKVSYFQAGSFDFNKFTCTISFNYNGKSIWKTSRDNQPTFLKSPRDKSYKQQLADAGAKPNLAFFGQATMPEYLQNPSAGGTGASGQQSIGASSIAEAKP